VESRLEAARSTRVSSQRKRPPWIRDWLTVDDTRRLCETQELHVDCGENVVRLEMADNGLPCLDLLEATPGILRGLMSELTDDDARWKPAPDRFSVAEVLAHLSHSEGHCYRMRVDRFLAETRPTFEPDDAQMYVDLYRDADPEDAFDHFEEQRETNVEYLRDLPSEAGGRAALHREAGQITLNQMLHEWALHDLGHIRQIAELVRARKYLEGAGPLGSGYQLKP
jgi:hypothetical protein